MAKEKAELLVDALHNIVVEVKAETLVNTVAKGTVADTVADALVNALTEWPIEAEPERQSDLWPM